jgi:zinc protease
MIQAVGFNAVQQLGLTRQQPSGAASSPIPTAQTLPFSAPPSTLQAEALKHAVLFGAKKPPKITYEHVKTLQDPILGEIQVYKFSNGMEFYGIKRDDVPLVSYGELIKTGSANETTKTNGASHFLEHLIFKGTKNLKPGEADKILEGLGAGLNAFTWLDETFYYVYDMPKESLGEAIRVWAELLSAPKIPKKELERERHAVAEEIRRDKQDPSGRLFEKLAESVWPNSRSKWTTLGPMANILTEKPKDGKKNHLTREQIMRFVNHYYDPSNRAIVVVGDFDLKETLDKVAYEHEIRPFKGKKAFKPLQPLKPGKVERNSLVRHDVKMSQLLLGFNGPSRQVANSEKQIAALELLSVILGGGGSSRLHQTLVENPENRLATSIGAGMSIHKNDNMFYVSAQIKPEKLDEARAAIRSVIEDVAQNGVTQRELDKAVKMKKRSSAGVMEQQRGLMSDLAIKISHGRLEDSYGNRIAKYFSQLTPADIQAAARDFLNAEAERSSALVPREFNRPPKAGSAAKTKGVQFAGALGPKDKAITLPGGTEVVVREKPGNINTAISLIIKGGRRLDGVPGTLTVLADVLQRGPQGQSAAAFLQRLDEEGISFATEAYNDTVELSFKSLSEDKDKLLKLIGEVLTRPAFRAEDIEFVKTTLREDYQSTLDTSPPAIANDLLQQQVYGADHPYGYGRTSAALIDRLDEITSERLEQGFQKIFTQPNITVSGVGDLTLNELAQATQGWVGHLPTEPVNASAPPRPALATSKVVTKSKEGLKQSEVMRAWAAPNLHDADRVPMLVLNYILSGGLSSRFFQTFRENGEKALCYSVYSQYGPKDQGGDFKFYIGTAPENTRLVMDMFQNEVNKLVNEPVSDKELKTTKLKLKSGILSRAQSTAGVASYLANHRTLSDLSHEELLDAIEQITPATLQAVAKKYLTQPSTTVVLAPKAALESLQLPVDGEAPLDY